MSLAGVILSGGASERMGRPKALLTVPDSNETFLDRLIQVVGAQCSPVIVVLGHEPERIRTGLARTAEAVFVVNPDYREGQLRSLQCGIGAVPEQARGFLFTLVDLPMVRPETVVRLAETFLREAPGALVIAPRHQGRRGHPVCCSRELVPEFLALGPGGQARDVVHRYAARTCYVDVDDPGVLRDIDDPEAYRALLEPAGPR